MAPARLYAQRTPTAASTCRTTASLPARGSRSGTAPAVSTSSGRGTATARSSGVNPVSALTSSPTSGGRGSSPAVRQRPDCRCRTAAYVRCRAPDVDCVSRRATSTADSAWLQHSGRLHAPTSSVVALRRSPGGVGSPQASATPSGDEGRSSRRNGRCAQADHAAPERQPKYFPTDDSEHRRRLRSVPGNGGTAIERTARPSPTRQEPGRAEGCQTYGLWVSRWALKPSPTPGSGVPVQSLMSTAPVVQPHGFQVQARYPMSCASAQVTSRCM